jgi:hypothetical protein
LALPLLKLLNAPSDLAQCQHAQVELASRPLLKPVHHPRLRFAAPQFGYHVRSELHIPGESRSTLKIEVIDTHQRRAADERNQRTVGGELVGLLLSPFHQFGSEKLALASWIGKLCIPSAPVGRHRG